MFDLRGWTPPVNAGPFRFRDPAPPLPDMSEDEVRERMERMRARLPALVDAWRVGVARPQAGRLIRRMAGAGVPRARLERYPETLRNRKALVGLLTPEELRELGGDS